MRFARVIFTFAVLLAVGFPDMLQADPVTKDRAELLFASLNKQAVRTYGARLEVSASLVAIETKEVLRISWSLDYDGSRQPLIILRPSLNDMTGGQTRAEFFLITKESELRRFVIQTPHAGGLPGTNPEWIITAKKGETAKGTIDLSLSQIRKAFDDQVIGDFNARKSLHFQLHHKPTERFSDAWTGSLFSRVLKVDSK